MWQYGFTFERPWFLLLPQQGKPIAVIPEIGAASMQATWIEDIRTWPAPVPEDEGLTLLQQACAETAQRFGTIGLLMGPETHLHMPLQDFERLRTALPGKQLIDAIKMIAYRAETAMANSLREHLKRPDEARRLLQSLYTSEADLLPNPQAGTLTVRLHSSANAVTDQAIEKLCEELNETETLFPRTELRLVLKLGSS